MNTTWKPRLKWPVDIALTMHTCKDDRYAIEISKIFLISGLEQTKSRVRQFKVELCVYSFITRGSLVIGF